MATASFVSSSSFPMAPSVSSDLETDIPANFKTSAYRTPSQTSKQPPPISDEDLIELIGEKSRLANGVLGNLTVYQENKLREIWILASSVFGVIEPQVMKQVQDLLPDASPVPQPETNTSTNVSTSSTGSKSTSISYRPSVYTSSFWGRKKEGSVEIPANETGSVANDQKSGQSGTTGTLSYLNWDEVTLNSYKPSVVKMLKEVGESAERRRELRNSFWELCKSEHPDSILLRFLRARKWVVRDAFMMALGALQWRKEEGLVDSDVLCNGEEYMVKALQSENAAIRLEAESFLKTTRAGKSWLFGNDKRGRPVCLVRVRMHRVGEQSDSSVERFTLQTIETARMMMSPPADTAVIIFDLYNFGLYNMDYTPVKFMIRCFEANYPESLGAILIHRAPWLFSSLWNGIKGWLDPVVANKVHFTKTAEDLSQYIDPSVLPTELGGTGNVEWKFVDPVEGENEAMNDADGKEQVLIKRREIAAELEELTMEWIMKSVLSTRGDHPMITQEIVEDAKRRRHTVALRLRKNYNELDKYVRARTTYDRNGQIPQ